MSARLAERASAVIAAAVADAGGREVAFVAEVDAGGTITEARVVARGTADAVLALPGALGRGQMALHNHPSGALTPSGADLTVAARLHDAGVGFGIVNNDATDLYVVVEVPKPRAVRGLDAVDAARLLAPDGAVSRALHLA